MFLENQDPKNNSIQNRFLLFPKPDVLKKYQKTVIIIIFSVF